MNERHKIAKEWLEARTEMLNSPEMVKSVKSTVSKKTKEIGQRYAKALEALVIEAQQCEEADDELSKRLWGWLQSFLTAKRQCTKLLMQKPPQADKAAHIMREFRESETLLCNEIIKNAVIEAKENE